MHRPRRVQLGFALSLSLFGCDSTSPSRSDLGESDAPELPGSMPTDSTGAPVEPAAEMTPPSGNEGTGTGSDIDLDPFNPDGEENGEQDPPETVPVDPGPSELALLEATIAELRRAIATRLVTPAELTQMYLARIEAFDAAGPALNAFAHVNEDAVADATALGTSCEDPAAPPLCGIPVVLKDNIDTADMPTTAGSVALEGSLPEEDAFLTRRLRQAGAVIIGKATLSEFANFLSTNMPSGYSSLGGYGMNPYDPRAQLGGDGRPVLTPGGSSSGPGIAVSANFAAAGVGTETAGSILSPASSNGIVGIKPTLGLVSRQGVIPISADQDTAGPMARSVTDAALLLGVMAGFDASDPATDACNEPGIVRWFAGPTTRNCESDYTQFLDADSLVGARIAVPPFGNSRAGVMQAAIDVLEAQGANVELIDGLPGQRGSCISVPAGNNCSTVLLYGFKRDLNVYLAATPAAPVSSLAEIIAFNNVTEGALRYGQQLALAAQALDTGPNSADTARYQSDRAAALVSAQSALDDVYAGEDGELGTGDDIDALLFSENAGSGTPAIAGYPSITVPGGFLPPNGGVQNPSPSGVTFSGPAFSEPRLVALAYAFEQATRLREPPKSTPALSTDTVRR